jgi:hypothetical protein
MAPALMVCWIEGGAGFFLFSFLLGGAGRATGSIAAGTRRRRHSVGEGNLATDLPPAIEENLSQLHHFGEFGPIVLHPGHCLEGSTRRIRAITQPTNERAI